jgi:hypothetical protein
MVTLATEDSDDSIIIHCGKSLSRTNANQLLEAAREVIANDSKPNAFRKIVLNLKECKDYDYHFLRTVAQLSSDAKKSRRTFQMIEVPKNLATYLRDNGFGSIVQQSAETETEIPVQKPQEDRQRSPQDYQRFIQAIIEGTLNSLRVQCSIIATPDTAFPRDSRPREEPMNWTYRALDVTAPSFEGSIVLCFPKKTLSELLAYMVLENPDRPKKSLEEGAKDLLDEIFDEARPNLIEQQSGRTGGIIVRRRVPHPSGQSLHPSGYGVPLVLPFSTQLGDFELEVSAKISVYF